MAMGNDFGLSLGIDIEWIAPERPVASIARSFLGDASADITVADFYRFWTFHESYFKAFQRTPETALALELIGQGARDGVRRLHDGTKILQHRVAETFQLSLVWSGAGDDCVPHHLGDFVEGAGEYG
ncbi:MAG TPA: 4'-phosphopantetheinyl transferase superfamily protein [Rhizomicrobium sp.]|nr:4'-phosphopantetheinyl transferase superfamily protein [Rhizomicrobium sp.]